MDIVLIYIIFFIIPSVTADMTYEDIYNNREAVIEALCKINPMFQRSHFSPLQPEGSQVVNVTGVESMLETNVFLQFIVTRIENVDADKQTMTFSAFGVVGWYDKSLSWNKTDGIYGFEIDKNVVWTPELVEESVLASNTLMNKVTLNYTGLFFQLTQKTNTIPCSVHILEFPFDSHVCHFNLSAPFTWFRRVKLTNLSGGTEHFAHTLEHVQWKLTSLSEVIDAGTYSLKIEVQRKATFFTVVLLLPCIFLNIMSIAVFLLPPKDGGRVDFAVNVMVTHYIFLLIMIDSLPPSGGTVPLLGIYILGSNGIVAFIVLASLLMVKLASYDDRKEKPPRLFVNLCRNRSSESRTRNKTLKDVDERNSQNKEDEADEISKVVVEVDGIIGTINRMTLIFTLASHVSLVVFTVVYWKIHRHIVQQ